MTRMVMSARIDTAGDFKLQFAQIALPVHVGKARRNFLRDGDRTGVGKAAIIEAGAGDDIADQVKIGMCQIGLAQCLPNGVQIPFGHMWQDDVLRMGDAQFVKAILLGKVSHHIDLRRCCIARNTADGLQADVDDRVTGLFVWLYVLIEPNGEIGVTAIGFYVCCIKCRRRKEGADTFQLCQWRIDAQRFDMGEFFRNLTAIFVCANFVDEYLDTRLVDIVAAAIAIVHAQAGFDVAEQVVGFNERVDLRRNHWRAAHAATYEYARTQFAVLADKL